MQNNPSSDATSANIGSGISTNLVTGESNQELSAACDASISLAEPQPGNSNQQACSANQTASNQQSVQNPAQQFQASSQQHQQQAMISSLLPSDPSGLDAPTGGPQQQQQHNQHQNSGGLQQQFLTHTGRQRGYQNHHQRHGGQSYHHNQHSMQHHGHHQLQQQQQQHHQHQHYHPSQQPPLHQAGKFRSPNESNINHVLLITVINPQYTVDCDLMHQLCSPYGKVNRIVIFKKNGVQSMVEFDNVEAAKRAKSILNGHDIYSGCCTLRIEYAKPTRLNVHKNDSESYDYTDPNLSLGSDSGAAAGAPGEQHSVHSLSFDATAISQHPAISQQHEQGSMHAHHDQQQQHHHHHHQGQQSHRIGGRLELGGRQQSSQLIHDNQPTDESNYSMSSNSMDPQQQLQQSPGQGGDISFESDSRGGGGGSFNTSRSGPGGGPSLASGGSGGAASSGYPNIDPYMPVEGLHSQSSPYSRQEGGHQQHQHHHNRHHHHHQAGQQHHHHPLGHPRSSIGPPHGNRFSGPGGANTLLGGPAGLVPPQGTVMMVYGLQTDKMTCDRLFNLFCLYGNVVKVSTRRDGVALKEAPNELFNLTQIT